MQSVVLRGKNNMQTKVCHGSCAVNVCELFSMTPRTADPFTCSTPPQCGLILVCTALSDTSCYCSLYVRFGGLMEEIFHICIVTKKLLNLHSSFFCNAYNLLWYISQWHSTSWKNQWPVILETYWRTLETLAAFLMALAWCFGQRSIHYSFRHPPPQKKKSQ